MRRMNMLPKGIIVPIVSPIDKRGHFNEAGYRDLIEYLAVNGIHGVFPFGTTGEFYAFTDEEYRYILKTTVQAVHGRMKIYAGANHITTQKTIDLAALAREEGVDALSILTPMFLSPSQEELYQFYHSVAESTDLPIVVYNNRPKTNVTVEPSTIRRLALVPNIVAVKDSTGDMTNTEEYIRLTRDLPDFAVLMGRDTLIYASLCYGATGAISSCANIAPALAVEIYDRFMQGDHIGALEAQFKLAALRIATNMGTFPLVIKEALRLIGHDVGDCVQPILPLEPAARSNLEKVLREIGLVH